MPQPTFNQSSTKSFQFSVDKTSDEYRAALAAGNVSRPHPDAAAALDRLIDFIFRAVPIEQPTPSDAAESAADHTAAA